MNLGTHPCLCLWCWNQEHVPSSEWGCCLHHRWAPRKHLLLQFSPLAVTLGTRRALDFQVTAQRTALDSADTVGVKNLPFPGMVVHACNQHSGCWAQTCPELLISCLSLPRAGVTKPVELSWGLNQILLGPEASSGSKCVPLRGPPLFSGFLHCNKNSLPRTG